MKHNTRAPLIWLAALVGVALFPLGWLAEVWGPFERLTGFLFGSEAAHAVGHTLLFSMIGLALLLALPALRRRPGLYMAAILAVAIGQEAFQLLYKGRAVAINDVTDIGTDLVAAGVVWALWYIGARQKAQAGDPYAQTAGR